MTELDAQPKPTDQTATAETPESGPAPESGPMPQNQDVADAGVLPPEPEFGPEFESEVGVASPQAVVGESDVAALVIEESEVAPEPEPGAQAQPAVEAAPDGGPRTVGRFIAEALRSAGVRYAFTVPGESFLGLLDAFEGAGIRVIATRHEGAASFMADAHGQLTGRPAVCLATRAVGGTNLAIGIHTARQNSTPFFAAVGQVERALLGREAFQEIDQVGTLGGLAKWAAEPHSAADVAATMTEAIRQALGGRPGPVLLALPEDLLDEPMPGDALAESGRLSLPRAADDEIRAVIELLASARRPVILAGAGILRARTSTELTRFAELLEVPIIASWRRPDVVSNDHPLYLGMAGLGAAPSVLERLEAADALLVIGSRLNEATSYGYTIPRAGMRWAHVDLAPGRPSGLPAPELAVASDAKAFLRAANERLVGRAVLDAERVAARQANNAVDRAAWEASSVVDADPWDGPGVHPGRTVATLRRVLPDDAILTTDAGNFAGWAGRGFRFRRPGTFLGTTSGAMGYGLPAAIAASLVHRDRAVVALVGDGGLGMTMAELETAVRVGARVVVVLFDNERYGTIRMWQERRGSGVGVGTELGPVDFAAIARACGARGVRVEKDAEFEGALRAALAADRPTVIQLTLDRRWVSVDQPPA
ncbi:MAG: thiamine pyrophosphate-binding protein [Candidatus Limnocylindrales bacterium]|nr:thiamine pyrophosphate-binding protein [Candidatus Limnocylindrales bacterium]